MKKFLAIFLALLMCLGVLASCGGGNNTDAATLDEAKELLDSMMKDKNGKVLANDYDVPAKLVIGDSEFEITWKTDNKDIKIKESSKKGFWTVDLPNVNEKEVEYKLTATIKNADGETIETTFTPKLAAVKNENLETDFKADVEYKAYIKQANLGYDVYVLNTTQNDENKFINTTMDPKEAAVFKFEIVEGGYKIYTMINGVKNYLHATATPKADNPDKFTKTIGFATSTDCVFTYDSALSLFKIKLSGIEFGVGTYGTYDTVSLSESKYFKADNINVKEGQFPLSFMTKENADKLTPSVKPENTDPKADTTLSIADAIALGNTKVKDQYTEGKYYIEGTVKEIQSDVYGNLVITDGTNDLLIYGTYSEDGKTRFDKLATKPAVGDKIKVYGVIGKYNDAQMKNGWIVGAVAGENAGGNTGDNTGDTPATPSDKTEVVTTPVAGTAYKFGAVQGNVDNKLLFINGQMANTHYFGTTVNAAEAIDVYVEAVTGGYNLYYMNGTTKTYINIKASGQYVNVKYETSDPTVYTFDATLKTFVVDVTCENESKTGTYCFGTYGTYETVSPTMTSKDLFPCQLYTVVEGEGGTETPENPGTEPENPGTEPENPGTPDTPACTEHADANGDYKCDNEGCGELTGVPAAGSTLTIPQANALGAAQANDAYVEGTYIVLGEVVSVSNPKFGEMTIKDADGNEFFVYNSKGADGTSYNDLAQKYVAGDKISVVGQIGQHNGNAQMKGGLVTVTEHNHAYDANNQGKCPCGAVDPDFEATHECADGNDEDFICDNPDCNVVIKPAADSTLTIKQALALAGLLGANEYTADTEKYYVTGVITGITNATDGRFSFEADGSTMAIYKAYSADGSKQFNAMDVVPVKGDTVTVYGVIGNYNGTPQMKNVWITNVVAHEHAYSDATCTAPKTCSICGATDGEALEHNYVDGTCDACGASKPSTGSTLATFEFGEKVAEGSHADGTEIASGKQYTDGNYTLTINSATKVYDGANDLKGNTCLKLGTNSLKGSFEFTVAEDVNKVIIKVAMYKAKDTTVSVNGIEQEITTSSNDGAYTSIEVDTSVNKTVTFATITNRAMIDAIIFMA